MYCLSSNSSTKINICLPSEKFFFKAQSERNIWHIVPPLSWKKPKKNCIFFLGGGGLSYLHLYLKPYLYLSLATQGVEKTPGYFHTAGVAARLRATAPHTKLLLIVR